MNEPFVKFGCVVTLIAIVVIVIGLLLLSSVPEIENEDVQVSVDDPCWEDYDEAIQRCDRHFGGIVRGWCLQNAKTALILCYQLSLHGGE